MQKKQALIVLVITILALAVWSFAVSAQGGGKTYTEKQYRQALNMLDPRPFDPNRDPDIDMYINSWTNSMPSSVP